MMILSWDLQTIMFKSPWNDGTPYTFTQTAHNQTVDKNDQLRKLFYVKNHKQTSIESALRLAQTGAVGSDYKVMDLTSGSQLPDTFHSGIVTLEAFVKDLGVNESLGLAIDSGLQIGSSSQGEKRSVDGYPSKSFSSVVASRQFYDDDGKPIHGYHDESLKSSMYKLKVKSAALRTILMNNVYTITVPGQPYLLDETAGVGSNIYLNYGRLLQHLVKVLQTLKILIDNDQESSLYIKQDISSLQGNMMCIWKSLN